MAITREAGTERELDGDTGMTRNPPGQSRRFLRAKRDMYVPQPDYIQRCPDIWPRRSGDWSGRKIVRLKFIEPLFKCGKHWYYLAECDCGNDTVIRAVKGDAASCGCASAKYGYRPTEDESGESTWGIADDDIDEAPVRGEFNRLHCLKDSITCRHFSECQDERVFERKKVSARYERMNANCYEGR